MTTPTDRVVRGVGEMRGLAWLIGLAAVVPVVLAQPAEGWSVSPLVFEEAPPTRLRTETDGGPVTDRCRDLARVISRDLEGQPQRRATLLQYYQRECPGEPLP